MGILSGIASGLAAVGSFIGNAISTIGPAIGSFAKSAVSIIAKIPIPGMNLFNMVAIAAKIVHAVVEALGIKTEEDPEILGAKAEQSDKKLEDFDNDVEAYIKYLKEEVQLDKEKFEKLSPEEKLGCKAIGMALETKVVEEKIGGVEISPECLATLTKIQSAGINVEAKDLINIIQILKSEGVTNLNDVVEYLNGKEESDRVKTGEALVSALGNDANDKIDELKDAVRQYEED